MNDLVAFLRARTDEDEATLRMLMLDAQIPGVIDPGGWAAERMLREVRAKRKRLALMIEATAEMDELLADPHAGPADQAMAVGRARAATVAAKYDAAVYIDHPDYQLDWR